MHLNRIRVISDILTETSPCYSQTPLDTERTAAGIVKYLKDHVTHKFEAPDVPEPETEQEQEQEPDIDYSGEAEEGYPEVDEEAEQEVEEQVTPVEDVDLKDEL